MTTCAALCPAAGADWDGDLTAGPVHRRAGSARGHLATIHVPRAIHPLTCIVSDAYGVEIYEDLSSNGYDAIDSERTMFRCRQAPCCS